jgi:hypothetical protein
MRGLEGRLTVLEKALHPPSLDEQIVEVALDTGQGRIAESPGLGLTGVVYARFEENGWFDP